MDFLEMLKHSYEMEKRIGGHDVFSPLEYIGENIFKFVTYDTEMSILFARKAIEFCDAVSNQKTYEYIKNEENYKWYLFMCNTVFFSDKLEWGISIRGAWWKHEITFQSCGLWYGENQLADDIKFNQEKWIEFMKAVSDFANLNIE